jgi:hypothetical protein
MNLMMIPRHFLILLLTALLASNVMAKVDPSQIPQVNPKTNDPSQSEPPVYKEPVPTRGEMLYTNHCLSCHESIVHIRNKRQVKNLAALHSTVSHWSKELELQWSSREIEDVVLYLNLHYYHYTE